jgi:hypothetical protein
MDEIKNPLAFIQWRMVGPRGQRGGDALPRIALHELRWEAKRHTALDVSSAWASS